ncbi:MAG TPA: hemerythrin domain-containing protein [Coriobacteriia bacterium]|nr:hemerythrin domain-containing protein [Coriobacteriia bacterium]
MAKDIYQRLEQDHREMQQMMGRLSERFDDRTFKKLATELTAHTVAEEKVLYHAVVKEEPAHQPVLEGYEEHHVAELILRELKSNQHGTDRWKAKFKVLKENVEHHIEEEESTMFSAVREVLPQQEAQKMVSKFESEKRKHH